MKSVRFFGLTALVLAAATAFGAWVYEGQWGSEGSGDGQFVVPRGVAGGSCGRVFVTDGGNHRVQYFRWTEPAVSPASLGRVRALFR